MKTTAINTAGTANTARSVSANVSRRFATNFQRFVGFAVVAVPAVFQSVVF
jgi:hypothetical protein